MCKRNRQERERQRGFLDLILEQGFDLRRKPFGELLIDDVKRT